MSFTPTVHTNSDLPSPCGGGPLGGGGGGGFRAIRSNFGVAMTDITSRGWISDNGNGTFSNPLFYDEFSDPDMIRVGDDYYLTGTTMHVMPGLPILHSKDLVNWKHLGYAFDRLDLGPGFRLEQGQEVYGQ